MGWIRISNPLWRRHRDAPERISALLQLDLAWQQDETRSVRDWALLWQVSYRQARERVTEYSAHARAWKVHGFRRIDIVTWRRERRSTERIAFLLQLDWNRFALSTTHDVSNLGADFGLSRKVARRLADGYAREAAKWDLEGQLRLVTDDLESGSKADQKRITLPPNSLGKRPSEGHGRATGGPLTLREEKIGLCGGGNPPPSKTVEPTHKGDSPMAYAKHKSKYEDPTKPEPPSRPPLPEPEPPERWRPLTETEADIVAKNRDLALARIRKAGSKWTTPTRKRVANEAPE